MKEQEQMDKPLRDLIEIIHFTERVSTKIHGLLDEAEICRAVKEESARSGQYTMSIVLLTDDKSKLKVAEVSLPLQKLKTAEKITGLQLKGFTIDLEKSSFYSQVVEEGKTVQIRFVDIISELFPKPVAHLISKVLGYTEKSSILTPLKRHGEIIGAFSMTSTELADHFIPSVKSLAQHISTALELADEYTERKKMEEALKKSEEKYRSIFENTIDIYYRADLEGNIILVSPSGAEIFGYESVEEVIGKNFAKDFYYHPEDREILLRELTKHGSVTNYEVTLKRKDGTPLVGETNSRFVYDQTGKSVGVEGMFRDITKRKKAEKNMQLLSAAIESSHNSIIITDMAGTIIYANKTAEEMAGIPAEIMAGRDIRPLFPDSKRVESMIQEVLEKGYFHKEFKYTDEDGREVWIFNTSALVTDEEGHPLGIVGVTRDITESKKAEEALRESEEKFRGIAERSFDGIYEMDLEGHITYASPAIERITGYKPDELQGDLFQNFAPESALIKGFQALARVVEGEAIKGLQVEMIRKDGTAALVEINVSPILKEGKVVGAQGIVRDITERTQAEEMLRQSEEKYKSLVENINVGVYRGVPGGGGQFTDVNQAFVKMLGYDKKEEILNLKVADIYCNSEDREKIREKILGQGFLKNEEITLKRKDGTSIIVSDTGKATYDTDGTILYFDGVLEDITGRKRTEEELERYRHHLEDLVKKRTNALTRTNEQLQQEIADRKLAEESLAAEKERLSVTLRSIGDGVITTDTEGTVVLINKVAERLTGYTQEEAVGLPLHSVFHIISERTRSLCENPVDKVLREGAVVGLGNNTMLIARDGTERIIADSGAPIRDRDSKIIGVILVFRDITEKRKTEQELLRAQKLESLGTLAGGIAHDFNNILTAVLSNTTLAKMYAEDTKVAEKLSKIEKASLQAKELTQQLLTFSRGGAPIKTTTSIAELIRDTASFALRGSNVRCHFYLPEELWHVDIDEGQISQVVNNLIINADQAMPEGGIIKAKAENVNVEEDVLPLDRGNYVKISITDQGVGIPEKYLEKIFDPYFTTKQKGSGLGLSTCYSIVKQHDGYITAESEVGVGTTFYMYLPASQKKREKKVEVGEVIKGEGKVLLMDDEVFVRDAAGETLQYLGYTVVTARDGKEAIDLYQRALDKEPFDVVIMDLTIPGGMGGKEAVSKLIEIDPHVKAIVASGYSTDPIMAEYREHGFKGVVTKPYTIEDLSKTLHGVLKG